MERCLSGWKSRSWKPVTVPPSAGSNPALSSIYFNIVLAYLACYFEMAIRSRKYAFLILEKYSRGRRGAPAKGVGRETGARVQIPPSPPTIPTTLGHGNTINHEVCSVFLYYFLRNSSLFFYNLILYYFNLY